MEERNYIPFSQREGFELTPPQLKIGEISKDLRRLLEYCIDIEFDRGTFHGIEGEYFTSAWERVAKDLHVLFFKHRSSTYRGNVDKIQQAVQHVTQTSKIGELFDLVEFFARHAVCSQELKVELANAFVQARAAYRLVDGQIIAIGSAEQAAAFERALEDAQGESAARSHLLSAGLALRNGDWAGSVRDSIHSVEAMARRLAPKEKGLGAALKGLEEKGHLHGSLKQALGKLYGYASDEEGVRHALVFNEEASVDEADALFMLGACAAFVSYLVARTTTPVE
ncbi:MAG: hypothetical protein OIF58_07370 [Cohaesibacter sp.]|nr:hypothetical protein [Cohaesibacter sp.]